jgi:hypothetical protein
MKAELVIQDRIFIAAELKKMDLLNKWRAAVSRYEKTEDVREFSKNFTEFQLAVIEQANSKAMLTWF